MSVSTKALFDPKAAKKVFELFDSNHDGIIDNEEIATVLRRLDAARWTDDRVKLLVKAFDNNGDGTIDADEFLAWIFSAEGGSAAFTLLADSASAKIDERRCRLASCKRGCKCPTTKCGGCGLVVKIPKHVEAGSSTRHIMGAKEGVVKAADLVRCRTCQVKENAQRMDTKMDADYEEQSSKQKSQTEKAFQARRRARAERLGPRALDNLDRQLKMESDPEFAKQVKELRKKPMQALKNMCAKYRYSKEEMADAMAEDEPSWALAGLIMEKEEEDREQAKAKAAKIAAAEKAEDGPTVEEIAAKSDAAKEAKAADGARGNEAAP